MYNLLTGFALGFVGFLAYNYKNVINYSLKFLEYNPGEGEIYKKRKEYFLRTPGTDMRLNYHKTPFFDINVYYFKNDFVPETGKITKKDFIEKYGDLVIYKLLNVGMGVIEDVYYTRNLSKGDLYGYISSYTEDSIYIFKIQKGVIDLEKVFDEYRENF